jgi:hypothetical protein
MSCSAGLSGWLADWLAGWLAALLCSVGADAQVCHKGTIPGPGDAVVVPSSEFNGSPVQPPPCGLAEPLKAPAQISLPAVTCTIAAAISKCIAILLLSQACILALLRPETGTHIGKHRLRATGTQESLHVTLDCSRLPK